MCKEFLGEAKVDDLVERYKTLLKDVEARLVGVDGAPDSAQVRPVHNEICTHIDVVQKIRGKVRPRPAIGDEVNVIAFHYDDRVDGFLDSKSSGTIIRIDGDDIEVRIPRDRRRPAFGYPEKLLKVEYSGL